MKEEVRRLHLFQLLPDVSLGKLRAFLTLSWLRAGRFLGAPIFSGLMSLREKTHGCSWECVPGGWLWL
jgi:hypothetical protein